jgi:hypothetical protein
MLTMERSSFRFEPTNRGEPVAEDAEDFVGRGLRELVANAVLHEAEGTVAEREAFTEALVGSHPAGAFDLFAGAGVHGLGAEGWQVFHGIVPRRIEVGSAGKQQSVVADGAN